MKQTDSYSLLIEKVVKAAEMEATLKRLLEEIEATKEELMLSSSK